MNRLIEDIKEKYKNNGYLSLTDKEKIILLLSYSEKGDNIEKSAERICGIYGNIHNAADSDIGFLMKECNLNSSSAVLINLISQINRRAEVRKVMRYRLNSAENAKQFFTVYLKKKNTEAVAVAVTDENFRIVNTAILAYGGFSEVHVPIRLIIDFILKNECKYLFIAHSHPNKDVKPSPSDIKSTINIRSAVESIGIKLVDHIITGINGAYSMKCCNVEMFTQIKEYKINEKRQ